MRQQVAPWLLAALVLSSCASGGAGPAAEATRQAATAPAPSPTPASSPSPPREKAEVVAVVDGDTIRVRIGGREFTVRYIGIDTPDEVGRPYASEATEANRRLVGGRAVELEKDVSETDGFGRLLRYVYVETSAGTVMVNAELVRLGFARATFVVH